MRAIPAVFVLLLFGLLLWSIVPASPVTAAPGFQQASLATPAYLHPTSLLVLQPTPAAPPAPVQGIGNSTIPPGPPAGSGCSVDVDFGSCSTLTPGMFCSATNNNNNRCSTVVGVDLICSVTMPSGACTVLPPDAGGLPSSCSVGNVDPNSQCSVVGPVSPGKCSAKAVGPSVCSALTTEPTSSCSVLNVGAPDHAFCSTRLNFPGISKNCSAFFASGASCSIALGGDGACTAFGAALPASCSAFAAGAFCSVIGGGAGAFCVQ